MANCTSELGIIHRVIDLDNSDEVIAVCHEILSIDNDLTENEDYFREDTLSLGFKNEAHRFVFDSLEAGHRGADLIEDVSNAISNQEYFGNCELSFEGNTVAFVYGG